MEKMLIALLCLILNQMVFSQQTGADSGYNAGLYTKGKQQIRTGSIVLALGAGVIIGSRLLPEVRRTGWSFGPQRRDVVLFAGIATFLTGTGILISGSSKIQKAKMDVGYEPYHISPGVQSYMPSLSLRFPIRSHTPPPLR